MKNKVLILSLFLLFSFSGCIYKEKMQIKNLESNNLSGKNLSCEEHNLFVTYNFLDNKRSFTFPTPPAKSGILFRILDI